MSDFADAGDRYRLDSRIATGGMGEVWRGTDTVLGREVAVKLLKAEYADDATFRARFETEARHAAALHHPGIAAVFDVGERPGSDGSGKPQPFLVMELVEGEPMSSLIGVGGGGRELDPAAVRDLLAQVGEALGAAHRAGIVHRDVKPANLIVTPQGKVKVTDFGIARAADGVGITRTGAVMGTPQYLSPEQAEGKTATSASDVYALGVVAFECLVGRRPFEADSPVATALAHLREPVPDLPASVPADLAAVVRRALSKKPEERYADGAAFAAALRDPATAAVQAPRVVPPVVAPVVPLPDTSATQVLGAVAADPPPTPAPTPAAGTSHAAAKRSPWPIVLAVVLLVALAIVLTLLLTGSDDDTEPTGDGSSSTTRTRSSEPTSESTSATSSDAATVSIDEGDYLGRPVDDVVSELEDLDLDVSRNEVANDDPSRNGQVSGVNPSGTLDVGSSVTVSFYGQAPEETEEPPPSEPTSEPTETETTETEPPPSEPTETETTETEPADAEPADAEPAEELTTP